MVRLTYRFPVYHAVYIVRICFQICHGCLIGIKSFVIGRNRYSVYRRIFSREFLADSFCVLHLPGFLCVCVPGQSSAALVRPKCQEYGFLLDRGFLLIVVGSQIRKFKIDVRTALSVIVQLH